MEWNIVIFSCANSFASSLSEFGRSTVHYASNVSGSQAASLPANMVQLLSWPSLLVQVAVAACFHVRSASAENPTLATTISTEDYEEELHEFDAVTVIVLCGCMFIALAMGYALHKYKFNYLPHSTAAMLLGVVVGGVAYAIQPDADTEFDELGVLTFSSEFFFYVLLPPIIFDAGYHFEKKRFFRNFSTILLFAVVGTILSTFIVGFIVYGFAVAGVITNVDDTSPLEALLFGSLISAVDPVATLSIMGNPELKYV